MHLKPDDSEIMHGPSCRINYCPQYDPGVTFAYTCNIIKFHALEKVHILVATAGVMKTKYLALSRFTDNN